MYIHVQSNYIEPPQLVKFTLMAAVWFPPDYSCVGEGEPALRLAVGGWDGGSVVQGYGDQCTRFKGMIRECMYPSMQVHVMVYSTCMCTAYTLGTEESVLISEVSFPPSLPPSLTLFHLSPGQCSLPRLW